MKPSCGKKVIDVASVISGLTALSAVIMAIVLFLHENTGMGFVALFVGALATWIVDVLLSGFGELVYNSEKLVNNSELLLKYFEGTDDSNEDDSDDVM